LFRRTPKAPLSPQRISALAEQKHDKSPPLKPKFVEVPLAADRMAISADTLPQENI
jgi:hypothetical protein